MSRLLLTMAEAADPSADRFALLDAIDGGDSRAWSRELAAMGWEVLWVNWRDFDPMAQGGLGAFRRMYCPAGNCFVDPMPLAAFDLAWVYKMEGFLQDQPAFFALVDALEHNVPRVMNEPALIRHNIDKTYLLDLQAQGVRTVPSTTDPNQARTWLRRDGVVVSKPLRSERSIGLETCHDEPALDRLSADPEGRLFQPFVPQVRDGERSLVFLGDAFQFAFLKVPAEGEIRCNQLYRQALLRHEPTPAELDLAITALSAYTGLGFTPRYSRVDLLPGDDGPLLIEAELLNPTINAMITGNHAFNGALVEYFQGWLSQDH